MLVRLTLLALGIVCLFLGFVEHLTDVFVVICSISDIHRRIVLRSTCRLQIAKLGALHSLSSFFVTATAVVRPFYRSGTADVGLRLSHIVCHQH